MNSIYYAKIGHRGTGFTNQIFALVSSIIVSNMQNKRAIICQDFCNDFSNDQTTPISEIIDIPQLNVFLAKYNVVLLDSNNVHFKIISARYGKNNATIDITNEIISNYYDDSKQRFYIPKNTNLNNIKGDPLYGIKKELCICYTINNIPFHEVVEEWVSNEVVFDLNAADWVHYFGWINSINKIMFDDILRNMPFHARFKEFAVAPLINGIVNVLHLRLEEDAINHWSGINNMTVEEFRQKLEEKYIDIIKRYAKVSDTNIILSGSTKNGVIDFMVENGYRVILPTKHFTNGRELNAIVDFLSSKNCNNLFIGNFNMNRLSGSTFSYFISVHLTNLMAFVDLDRINDPHTLFFI